jgi:ligand-binding sensor domain-containing protein
MTHSFASPSPVSRSLLHVLILAILVPGAVASTSPARPSPAGAFDTPPITATQPTTPAKEPISRFIRRIFEDRSGNLWLGTNGDGVARYDGNTVEFFSIDKGFAGLAVRAIVQDKHDAIWFGTERGLIKYDGTVFTTYTTEHGLAHDDIWSILIDRAGRMWIGTYGGVSQFDGTTFITFQLPAVSPDVERGVSSAHMVSCIMQDRRGRMWFGTAGGAFVQDGRTLTKISEADGLCNNTVNCILEDREGRIWFATHHNGICRLENDTFTHFTANEGVHGSEAWDLYEDRSGNIWFPIENAGVYRYDGKTFTNFGKAQGLTSGGVQCTYQDRAGRLWFGGWQGLFRCDGESIVHISKDGPWNAG